VVEDGWAHARRGGCQDLAVVVRNDAATFLALASGAVTPAAARRRHLVDLDGDAAAFDRLFHDLGLTFGS
jgi:hypothetical protein